MDTGIPHNRDITYFGKTNFRNSANVFGIKRKDRRQHMYILGKSGTGKSVLLSNLIVQNIQNGEGICVVDPHGELVEEVLSLIPDHRVKDVIYFNPADTDFHIGFNVLQIDDPKYKHLVASGLMGIFTKIWANAWSSRMEYILNNAILALLDTPGTTLLGIPRILVDKDYRQMIVNNLKDPVVKAFWVHEYEQWRDQFRNEAIAPIQNKVGQFLSTSIIRNVVGQPRSTIDIFDIMNEGKIFLVNVSKGRVGEDNSALLGGMLITKIQLAAMERVRIPENDRKDFYLYVDEFQNFATDSFANILSEARKYRLNLIIAHQYTAQLENKDGSKVRDAVFGNVGTMIIFRVGADDADFLEKEFEPEFMAQDLVNLPNYHVYLKLMIDGVTSRPFSASTLPPIKVDLTANVKDKIIESSRKLFTKPREEVENEIMRWSGTLQSTDNPEVVGKFKATCLNCGKEIMVPFEPDPKKPIYCKDCLFKIKEGNLEAAKGFITPKAFKQDTVNSAALSALGIEFKSDGTRMDSAFTSTADHAPKKDFAPRDNKFPSKPFPPKSTNPNDSKFTPKPFVKKTSGPSPLLKGLLDKIKNSSPEKLDDKKEEEVVEVKKPAVAPISLASLKKSSVPTAQVPHNTHIKPKTVLPSREASEEKKNSLKDLLAKVAPAAVVAAPVKAAPVEDPKVEVVAPVADPAPVKQLEVEVPVVEPTIPEVKPEIKVEVPVVEVKPEPVIEQPVVVQSTTVEEKPIQIEEVNTVVEPKIVEEIKPEIIPEVILAPTVEEVVPIAAPASTPEKNITEEVAAPDTNASDAWQKRVPTKEVPEDVLKKVLE